MSARITPERVVITRREPLGDGTVEIEARVRGRQRVFVVDFNPRWSQEWLCSCGKAPACAHVRATREVVKL